MAMKTQVKYGVPSSITIAQAAIESRWGDSKLSKQANNFFGIRANKGYTGDVFNIDTNEFINGQYITDALAAFRAYVSPAQSFTDHAKFLLQNKRYNSLFDSEDSTKWAEGLQKAGYATAPNYADTIKTVIRQNNLTDYDKKAKLQETTSSSLSKKYRRNKTLFVVFGSLLLVGGGILTYNHFKHEKA